MQSGDIGQRRIKVVLVDDHAIVREGLRALLDNTEMQVVGEAASGREAVQVVAATHPDVVLMDVRMSDMDGLAATKLIKHEYPKTAVIILTSFENKEYLREAILHGAAGYLLKGASQAQLVNAIGLVMEGNALFDTRTLNELLAESRVAKALAGEQVPTAIGQLSERERQTLQLIARGMTNKEIADTLGYSVGTIKNVIQEIIQTLGVSDRTQAAVAAMEAGLIDL